MQFALTVPGVKDRVAQAAVRIVIEPLFEASFRPGSYGFRPKRGVKQAIYDIRKWVTYGYDKVIDLDLKSYFDTIGHELLMKLMRRRVRDPRVLRLIRRWLRAGVMHEGAWEETLIGSPQGAVISPLLSKHLPAPAGFVLGAGGEGDQDGSLRGRPGGAVPMEASGDLYAEAEAVPGAAAGNGQ